MLDNIFIDNEYGISVGGNATPVAGVERFEATRVMDNVFTETGLSVHNDINVAQPGWTYDWQDGVSGGNIYTKNNTADRGIWAGGIMCNNTMTNTIWSRNFIYDDGVASGTTTGVGRGSLSMASGGTFTNVQFLSNYIINANTDAPCVGNYQSGSDSTFDGNVYYTLATNGFEVDEVDGTYAAYITANSETNSSNTNPTIVEARTIETYQQSLGGTQTIDAFIDDTFAIFAPGSWDTDYEAKYIVQYFKAGYTE